MKAFMGIVAAAGLTLAATAASAATFDMVALANTFMATNGYEGTWDQATGGSYTVDGITISSVSAVYARKAADPFLDSTDGSGSAGLGVCHSGTYAKGSAVDGYVSNCATGGSGSAQSDDNLTLGEDLTINFDRMIAFNELTIKDELHKDITAASAIMISSDGGLTFGTYSATGGVVDLLGLAASDTYWFRTIDGGIPQIYLSSLTVSQVPVPATGLLLLGGLGGLGAMRRRRKA